MTVVIQRDASLGDSTALNMYTQYHTSCVKNEANLPFISTGADGIGFFGISVTNWCNTARSGPNIAFT